MITKIFIFLFLIAMVASLGSALWFMMKDQGHGTRAVKALTWRIVIWVVLFVLLGIGIKTGIIQPHNSMQPQVERPNPNP